MLNSLKNIVFKLIPPSVMVKYLLVVQALKSDPILKVFEDYIGIGDIVLDIGAHYGIYTTKLSKLVGKEGVVYAFEPNLTSYCYLSKAVSHLHNVKQFNLALSDKNTTRRLITPFVDGKRIDALSTLSSQYDSTKNTVYTKVKTQTIPEILKETRVNIIKIDVEGHEFNVLKGAKQLLMRYHPHLVIELEHRHTNTINKTIKFLHNLGYDGYAITHKGMIPLKYYDIERNQVNFNFENNKDTRREYTNNFLFYVSN